MSPAPLKKRVRDLLEAGNLEVVAELANDARRVLGTLVALTFDPDQQVVWRAIEAMGMAVETVAEKDKGYAKEHMRRLYWLITEESGGVFWRAPECMAECAARLPELFKSHIPIAFHLLETMEEEDLEHFRPGAIWAVGRLADLARHDLPGVLPLVIDALDRPEPQVRGLAVWCLGKVGETGTLHERKDLLADEGLVRLYRERNLEEVRVGELAAAILGGGDSKG